MSQFYEYFKENMNALGFDAPASLYDTQQRAVATAGALITAIEKLGKTATVAEVVGATTRLEKLLVIGALSAAFYVGAVIGSIAIATGRAAAGGTSLSDVFFTASAHGLRAPWLANQLSVHPEIYRKSAPRRSLYALKSTSRRQSAFV